MRVRSFLRSWWAWAADVVDDLLDAGEPRAEPSKADLAMKVERALVARYLRERAKHYGMNPHARELLTSEANRIAGGMHYR